jgi:hypothetical protein
VQRFKLSTDETRGTTHALTHDGGHGRLVALT